MTEFQRQLIVSLGRQVRAWVEERDQLRENPTENLQGFCAIATAQLSRLLFKYDVDHKIHMRELGRVCHCFIIVEDHILDITATQFQEFVDCPVLLMHRYMGNLYPYYEITYTFNNADELRAHQKKYNWVKHQVCYKGLARMDTVCA